MFTCPPVCTDTTCGTSADETVSGWHMCSLLGPTWLSWQVASGAVLAESAFPLHLLLQYTQGELANSLFKGVLREVGVAQPAVLPPGQAAEVQGAAAARRRARGAALTGPAAVITAPAQLLADLLNGRPGDGWLKGWVRLTASGPLLVFWPYGPALYAWINGYATGISHHQAYFQAKGVTDREEQEAIAQSRAGQYRRFGATAMGLSLLPIVGWGLSVLSAAGAALWAAELEGSGGRQPGRLYQGGPTVFDGQEYGLVEMEEGSTAIKR
mmetsp:Transcript_14798/g.44702  ORF Transcript_14798/g.44702 Transcript_14798/m.44702 type:complete len:269 (+) Transcript_14798:873-1679(+)